MPLGRGRHSGWEAATATARSPLEPVAAVGGLAEPSIPHIPGINRFHRQAFHSARWDHDYDLDGRTVAVVGTGASAIQFVPEIQPAVGGCTCSSARRRG